MTDIEKTISELFRRETEFKDALTALPEIENRYKTKKAVEYLKADGSVEARKAIAEEKCAQEALEYLQADARATLAKELLNDCRAVLSAKQSILSAEFRYSQAYSKGQV
jgi:hypothetical protein